jgi:hypothetical protein
MNLPAPAEQRVIRQELLNVAFERRNEMAIVLLVIGYFSLTVRASQIDSSQPTSDNKWPRHHLHVKSSHSQQSV